MLPRLIQFGRDLVQLGRVALELTLLLPLLWIALKNLWNRIRLRKASPEPSGTSSLPSKSSE